MESTFVSNQANINRNISRGSYEDIYLDLCVANNPNDSAVFLHELYVLVNELLANGILPFLGGIGECLLLGVVPVVGLNSEGLCHSEGEEEEAHHSQGTKHIGFGHPTIGGICSLLKPLPWIV